MFTFGEAGGVVMDTTEQDKCDWPVTTLASEDDAFGVLARLRGERWLSRGHSRCYDGLLPTIERNCRNGLSRIEKLTLERRSIDLFRSTLRYSADSLEQKAQKDDLVALMLLRHYKVPTRLIDWSLSPYVAAYFSVYTHPNVDGEIWSFDESIYAEEGRKQWTNYPETTIDGSGDPDKFDYSLKSAFRVQEPPDWFVCLFYPEGFARQDAQQGAYSITARFGRDQAQTIAHLLKKSDHYHRYVISAALKPALTKALRERHGIWRGSLFPDVAGAAETADTVFQKGV
jgi:hypothetical protein